MVIQTHIINTLKEEKERINLYHKIEQVLLWYCKTFQDITHNEDFPFLQRFYFFAEPNKKFSSTLSRRRARPRDSHFYFISGLVF